MQGLPSYFEITDSILGGGGGGKGLRHFFLLIIEAARDLQLLLLRGPSSVVEKLNRELNFDVFNV